MGATKCAVVGCVNSSKMLSRWKKRICNVHNVLQGICGCEPPFRLYCFPGKVRYVYISSLYFLKAKQQNFHFSLVSPTSIEHMT